MSKLEKAIYELNKMERTAEHSSPLHRLDPRAKLLATLFFLVFLLSLPPADLSGLILFFIYPIVSSERAGISYAGLFRRSLVVLPFVAFVGIFNPIIDKKVLFYVNGVGISSGWVSFVSILIRGIISVQAVLLLIFTTGFYHLCKALGRMGIPSVLTTQLLFVYRYISVLLQEALSMRLAREARSFGRESYSFKMWGVFIGQLLLRTIDRSERIYRAMLSRGFTGKIEGSFHFTWRMNETLYLAVWTGLFAIFRFYRPADLFNVFLNP